jgi:chromosome partitioning protein
MERRKHIELPSFPVTTKLTVNSVKGLTATANYQAGVIDGAAYAARSTLEFAQFADLLVIPTSYSLDDKGSARRLVKSLLEKGVPASRICIALSGVEESSVDETEARDYFAPLGVSIAAGYAPRFKSIGKAQDRGLSICEVPFPRLAALAAKMIDSIIDRALEVKST